MSVALLVKLRVLAEWPSAGPLEDKHKHSILVSSKVPPLRSLGTRLATAMPSHCTPCLLLYAVKNGQKNLETGLRKY